MKRINNDVNGNPRYVVHFYDILNDGEGKGLDVFQKYEIAVKKARKVGGKMYRGKDFGGGIVFQSYDIQATVNLVRGI
jgi:hypothetical protein